MRRLVHLSDPSSRIPWHHEELFISVTQAAPSHDIMRRLVHLSDPGNPNPWHHEETSTSQWPRQPHPMTPWGDLYISVTQAAPSRDRMRRLVYLSDPSSSIPWHHEETCASQWPRQPHPMTLWGDLYISVTQAAPSLDTMRRLVYLSDPSSSISWQHEETCTPQWPRQPYPTTREETCTSQWPRQPHPMTSWGDLYISVTQTSPSHDIMRRLVYLSDPSSSIPWHHEETCTSQWPRQPHPMTSWGDLYISVTQTAPSHDIMRLVHLSDPDSPIPRHARRLVHLSDPDSTIPWHTCTDLYISVTQAVLSCDTMRRLVHLSDPGSPIPWHHEETCTSQWPRRPHPMTPWGDLYISVTQAALSLDTMRRLVYLSDPSSSIPWQHEETCTPQRPRQPYPTTREETCTSQWPRQHHPMASWGDLYISVTQTAPSHGIMRRRVHLSDPDSPIPWHHEETCTSQWPRRPHSMTPWGDLYISVTQAALSLDTMRRLVYLSDPSSSIPWQHEETCTPQWPRQPYPTTREETCTSQWPRQPYPLTQWGDLCISVTQAAPSRDTMRRRVHLSDPGSPIPRHARRLVHLSDPDSPIPWHHEETCTSQWPRQSYPVTPWGDLYISITEAAGCSSLVVYANQIVPVLDRGSGEGRYLYPWQECATTACSECAC